MKTRPRPREMSYDPLTANPLGRTIQIGLRKRY